MDKFLNSLESYGACTRNENGMYEVHWEEPTNWFKKLFNIQTNFKFECDYEVGKRISYDQRYFQHLDVEWFYEEGSVVKNDSVKNKIIKTLLIVKERDDYILNPLW